MVRTYAGVAEVTTGSPIRQKLISLLSGLLRSSGRSNGSGITARSHAVAITETTVSLHWVTHTRWK